MLLDKKDSKELTDKQRTFLSVLFSEADGDPRKAAELAGYAPTSYPRVVQGLKDEIYPRVVQGLKDEIIERAESVLAAHSPQAALGISRALTDDGSIPGANIRMEAAKQILDRVGLVKKEKIDVNAKVAHGIFVLPAKEA